MLHVLHSQVCKVQVHNILQTIGVHVEDWISESGLSEKSVWCISPQTEREQIKYNVHLIQLSSSWVARGCKALILPSVCVCMCVYLPVYNTVCACVSQCFSSHSCNMDFCVFVCAWLFKHDQKRFSRHEKEMRARFLMLGERKWKEKRTGSQDW